MAKLGPCAMSHQGNYFLQRSAGVNASQGGGGAGKGKLTRTDARKGPLICGT
jgi:hypothetical protein